MRKVFAIAAVGSAICFANGSNAQQALQRDGIWVHKAQAKRATTSLSGVPADYRKRAAAIIKNGTSFKIRDAQISKPMALWAGIQWGGELPGVCALIFRDNPFGTVVRDTWQITFKDGAVAGYGYANIACTNTTKFHEVLAR